MSKEERTRVTFSVGLMVAYYRRLILVRHGDKDGGLWGLPAGGVHMETIWETARREFGEEVEIDPKYLSMTEIERRQPRVISCVDGENERLQVGIIYSARLMGQNLDLNGWEITEDRSVSFARPFSIGDVCGLVLRSEEIYKPRFNFSSLVFWMTGFANEGNKKAGVSLEKADISGLGRSEEDGSWVYDPPYDVARIGFVSRHAAFVMKRRDGVME